MSVHASVSVSVSAHVSGCPDGMHVATYDHCAGMRAFLCTDARLPTAYLKLTLHQYLYFLVISASTVAIVQYAQTVCTWRYTTCHRSTRKGLFVVAPCLGSKADRAPYAAPARPASPPCTFHHVSGLQAMCLYLHVPASAIVCGPCESESTSHMQTNVMPCITYRLVSAPCLAAGRCRPCSICTSSSPCLCRLAAGSARGTAS